ncbi:hypothetical protein QNF03_004124, partial [Vibrio cidicii]|nr:hypothetical protein [Vibrio cidicii]
MSAVRSLFHTVDHDSRTLLLHSTFRLEQLDQRASEIIKLVNYEVAALEGENVVLFSEPLLVSTFKTNNFFSLNVKDTSLRLISYKGNSKKFVSSEHLESNSRIYNVNEVIWGAILPEKASFKDANVLDITRLPYSGEKVTNLGKVSQDLFESGTKIRDELNSLKESFKHLIDEDSMILKDLKSNVESLLREKDRVSNNVQTETETLLRIKSDIDTTANDLDRLNERKSQLILDSRQLNLTISEKKRESNEIDSQIKSNKIQITESREELMNLQNEIAIARADINLTTLDMKGYSKESNLQVTRYYIITLAVLSFLGGIFYLIYT